MPGQASGPLPQTIRLVGGGKMGAALAGGWLAAGLPAERITVVEPDPGRQAACRAAGLTRLFDEAADLEGEVPPEALVLAVKPQVMDEVALAHRGIVGPQTLVLSIAAGKPIHAFERAFGTERAIVRAMPNTPAAVGRGVTVLCANPATSPRQRALASALMAAVGEVHWIADEELMHAVTALSGSGPAYLFHLIEAMAAAGVAAGLPAELAMSLARGTVTGAGELAHQAEESPAQLRMNVTSPGGTTAAALAVLMDGHRLAALLTEAVAAAAARSRELGQVVIDGATGRRPQQGEGQCPATARTPTPSPD